MMKRINHILEKCKHEERIVFFNEPVELEHFSGIIFYYAAWSTSLNNLQALIKCLAVSSPIKVCIFDLDLPYYNDFLLANVGVARGWGDLFWFKDGHQIGFIKRALSEFSDNDLHEISSYNAKIL